MLRSVFLGLCGCLTLAASVACSSAASEEEELDEGALAERRGDISILDSHVRDGLFPKWHGAGDKIWTANRRGPSFGLVGATPLYTAPAGASIEAMATTATGAKLLVTQQDQSTSLVSVDFKGTAIELARGLRTPQTQVFVDAQGASFFVGATPDRPERSRDLIRVDPSGAITRIAPDFYAPRPNDFCNFSMFADAESFFGVQACEESRKSDIVQVPKTGGSARVIAGVSGYITGATLTESSIVFTHDNQIREVPKGPPDGSPPPVNQPAKTLATIPQGPVAAVAVRGQDVWFALFSERGGRGAIGKIPRAGGGVTMLGELPGDCANGPFSSAPIVTKKGIAWLSASDGPGGKLNYQLVEVSDSSTKM